jgi:CBS domain-containing protein
MATMRAAQIMRRPVLAATRKTTVRNLITHLVANQISGLPVVEPDGTVVGVVSEGDVLRVLVEGDPLGGLLVQDIMTTEPVTVDSETPMSEVLYTMHTEAILRVPVTKAGMLVGIISRSDLIRTVAESEPLDEPDFLIF